MIFHPTPIIFSNRGRSINAKLYTPIFSFLQHQTKPFLAKVLYFCIPLLKKQYYQHQPLKPYQYFLGWK